MALVAGPLRAPARQPQRRRSGPAPVRPAPPRPPGPRTLHPRAVRALDGLLRGPAWVVLVGALLAGIVFLNVSVLSLNQGIAATNRRAEALQQTNSVLRFRLAQVGSASAIQHVAEGLGYVLPQPGDVVYVRPSSADAKRAAARLASTPAAPAYLTGSGAGAPAVASGTRPATVAANSAPVQASAPSATATTHAAVAPTASPTVSSAPATATAGGGPGTVRR